MPGCYVLNVKTITKLLTRKNNNILIKQTLYDWWWAEGKERKLVKGKEKTWWITSKDNSQTNLAASSQPSTFPLTTKQSPISITNETDFLFKH